MTKRIEKLIAEGWVRRFSAEEPRLSEAINIYHELGLEVQTVPTRLEDEETNDEECSRPCISETVFTIFTRGDRDDLQANMDDELFPDP